MKAVLLLTAVLLSSTMARADQCAVLDSQQAVNAVSLIQQNAYVIRYCEPCGETVAVRVPVRDLKARIFDINANFAAVVASIGEINVAFLAANVSARFTLLVNGVEDTDMAYLYDQRGFNLGAQSGCANSSRFELPHSVPVIGSR